MINDEIKDAFTIDLELGPFVPDEIPEKGPTGTEKLLCKCGNQATVFLMGNSETLCLCVECAYPGQADKEVVFSGDIRWMSSSEDEK